MSDIKTLVPGVLAVILGLAAAIAAAFPVSLGA